LVTVCWLHYESYLTLGYPAGTVLAIVGRYG
jgi:hypothetical protein